MTASVVKTLKKEFDQVEVYPTFDPDLGAGAGNLVIVAYRGVPRSIDWPGMRRHPVDPFAYAEVWGTIGKPYGFPEGTPAILLTDDYNPADFYDAWLRESVRREILESTDWDMLM